MSTSALAGSGSVIDVRGIVDQLMQVESRPLVVAKQRVSAATVSISAMSEVKSLVDKVASSAKSMEDTLMLSGRSVSSSDAALVKASVSNPALVASGTFTVSGTHLAQSQRTAFAGFSSPSTDFGAGYGELKIQGISADFGAVSDVAISLAGKSLEDVRDEINNGTLSGKVVASIVNTGDASLGYILVLNGAKTGATASFSATWLDARDLNGDGVADDQLNYNGALVASRTTAYSNPLDSTGKSLNQVADDAKATINGIPVRSKENAFTQAIPGLTFDLLKADPVGTSTLTISDNRATLKERIRNFVADFSALNQRLQVLTKPGKPGEQAEKPGPLSGNSGILSLSLALYSAYTEGFAIKPTSITETFNWNSNVKNAVPAIETLSWSLLGLEWTREGAIVVKESVFNAAIDGVTSLAGQDRRLGLEMLGGFTSALKDSLNGFRGVEGTVQSSIEILQLNRTRLSTSVSDMEARLERTRKGLISKYASLDSKLASMSQMSANMRASLAGLSG